MKSLKQTREPLRQYFWPLMIDLFFLASGIVVLFGEQISFSTEATGECGWPAMQTGAENEIFTIVFFLLEDKS